MKKDMMEHWTTINDDELRSADKAAEFLQGEFCPPGADPMWSPEYFAWKLGAANPAGKGFLSLAMVKDTVIGTVSLTRKRMLIDGKECLGGEVGDTYSSARMRRSVKPGDLSPDDPDPGSYVNKSIFGRLASDVRRRAEEAGVSVIFGTPNANAYPGWVKRLGYFDFEECGMQSFTRPTAELIARRYPFLSVLSGMMRGMEHACVASQKFMYNRFLCRNLTIGGGVPSPDEFEELWARLKPGSGFSLVRDAAHWRHRYQEHPLARYTFFSVREKGRLAGVMVTRLISIGGGRRVAYVAEWMKEENIPFGYLLASVMDHYRDAGVDAFSLWAGKATKEGRAAARNLFLSRYRIPIVISDTPQARPVKGMHDRFLFFLGSSDNV